MKILIATDGSTFSEEAIGECLKFLGASPTKFRVVSFWDEPEELALATYDVAVEYYKKAEDQLRRRADAAVKSAEIQIRTKFKGTKVSIDTRSAVGTPEKMILQEARDWAADLIVVGSHGRSFWGRLLGSVSTDILHNAPCSVFVGRRGLDLKDKK